MWYRLGGAGGGAWGSERVAVPHPRALGVVEPVRQPLCLQQLQPVLAQVQRLAASAHNKCCLILHSHQVIYYVTVITLFRSYIYVSTLLAYWRILSVNSLEIPVLLVIVVEIKRAPQAGAAAADHDDVRGRHHQEDACTAAALHRVLHRHES